MANLVRLPRSFAGDKSAPLDIFFESTAHALKRGDPSKQEATARICERIRMELSARVIIDVGGLMKVKRSKMLELLASIDKDLEHWVEYLEDVLDFEFPTPAAVEAFRDPSAPPLSAALVPISSAYRVATYKTERTEKKAGIGAQLQLEGKLDSVRFAYSMFTKLVTQNPKEETLKQQEVEHINDTVWEYTFEKFGEVHVDIIYRKHCGRQLRLLFPNLPNYGGKKGDERTFEDMLKWRFQNPRKTVVDGKKVYKPNLKIDRINLCEAALELIEEKKFPVTIVDEGKLETKFSFELDTDTNPVPAPAAQRASYFGGLPPPPPLQQPTQLPLTKPPTPQRLPAQGPLAPVSASAANCTAINSHPQAGPGKRAAQVQEKQPKMPKKPRFLVRTEPVYARRAPKLSSPLNTHRFVCMCPPAQVALFKETKFDVPLKALPYRPLEKDDEVVVCVPYTNDDGILVPDYWYGVTSLVCANAVWIKFYDVTDDTKKAKPISEEKHKLKPDDYFDTWMLVEKIEPAVPAAEPECGAA